jgi:hypothetical protein
MTVHDYNSIVGLAQSVLADTRALMRYELDLMRAEVREEVLSARSAGLAFGGAAVAAMLGLTLMAVALGSAIAYGFGWPAWTGYAIVSLLLLSGAYIAMVIGRRRLGGVRALPKTRATLKENLTWIQGGSALK